MKVLYFEVGKIGVELKVENTLDSLSKLVDGYIEVVRIHQYKNVILVCNEEGRLLNLPPNRTLKNIRETIYGNFFICQFDGEEMCSIDDDVVGSVIKLFS